MKKFISLRKGQNRLSLEEDRICSRQKIDSLICKTEASVAYAEESFPMAACRGGLIREDYHRNTHETLDSLTTSHLSRER